MFGRLQTTSYPFTRTTTNFVVCWCARGDMMVWSDCVRVFLEGRGSRSRCVRMVRRLPRCRGEGAPQSRSKRPRSCTAPLPKPSEGQLHKVIEVIKRTPPCQENVKRKVLNKNIFFTNTKKSAATHVGRKAHVSVCSRRQTSECGLFTTLHDTRSSSLPLFTKPKPSVLF